MQLIENVAKESLVNDLCRLWVRLGNLLYVFLAPCIVVMLASYSKMGLYLCQYKLAYISATISTVHLLIQYYLC